MVADRPLVLALREDLLGTWDLATGAVSDRPISFSARDRQGRPVPVYGSALATAVVDARPIAVVGQYGPTGAVRLMLWDLATGRPSGALAVPGRAAVCALATTTVDGHPTAVTGDGNGRVRLWDLAGRREIAPVARLGHADVVASVASVVLQGHPVAVTLSSGGYGEHALRVWDLSTGRQVGEPLHPDFCSMTRMAAMSVDGWAMVVTEGDGQLWLWDLAGRQLVQGPITDCPRTAGATTMITMTIEGRPVAVTGGHGGDGRVRVHPLLTGAQVAPEPDVVFPQPVTALAAAPDDGLLVGFGQQIALLERMS